MAKTEGGKGSKVYWGDTHGYAKWINMEDDAEYAPEVSANCPTCGNEVTFTPASAEDINSYCDWFNQKEMFGYGPDNKYDDPPGGVQTGSCMKDGCGWSVFTDDNGVFYDSLPTIWVRWHPVTVKDDADSNAPLAQKAKAQTPKGDANPAWASQGAEPAEARAGEGAASPAEAKGQKTI